MATRRVDLGPFGDAVRGNVARLRAELGLSAQELSARTATAHRPLGRSAISEIERGARRVDVDDLASLAIGLSTSPTELLVPSVEPGGTIHVDEVDLQPLHIRHWLTSPSTLDEAMKSGPGPAAELQRVEAEMALLDEKRARDITIMSALFLKITQAAEAGNPDLPWFQRTVRKMSDDTTAENERMAWLQRRAQQLRKALGATDGDDGEVADGDD